MFKIKNLIIIANIIFILIAVELFFKYILILKVFPKKTRVKEFTIKTKTLVFTHLIVNQ